MNRREALLRVRVGILLAFLFLLPSCEKCEEPAPSESPSVVVIVLDTLRADHVSGFGEGPDAAPRIAELARSGASFRTAMAASPWTGPSVAAILTGKLPDEVGIHRLVDPLAPSAVTLAERFEDAGYTTAAVLSNGFAGPAYGYDQGYDYLHFEPYKGKGRPGESGGARRPVFTADRVADQAIEWLESARGPFFLHVHFTDPHDPYLPPQRWRDSYLEGLEPIPDRLLLGARFADPELGAGKLAAVKASYAAEVAFTDHEVGRLLDALPPDTIVALTGDHGEEFLEHGGFRHGHSLYQELLHVPLVFSGPGVPAGLAVDRAVSHVDVAPTLLDLAGLPRRDPLTGQSLTAHFTSQPEGGAPRVLFSIHSSQRAVATAVRMGRWKLIQSPQGSRLYDLRGDPAELEDVSTSHPRIVATLQERIQARKGAAAEAHFDSAEREQQRLEALRALGYIE